MARSAILKVEILEIRIEIDSNQTSFNNKIIIIVNFEILWLRFV